MHFWLKGNSQTENKSWWATSSFQRSQWCLSNTVRSGPRHSWGVNGPGQIILLLGVTTHFTWIAYFQRAAIHQNKPQATQPRWSQPTAQRELSGCLWLNRGSCGPSGPCLWERIEAGVYLISPWFPGKGRESGDTGLGSSELQDRIVF